MKHLLGAKEEQGKGTDDQERSKGNGLIDREIFGDLESPKSKEGAARACEQDQGDEGQGPQPSAKERQEFHVPLSHALSFAHEQINVGNAPKAHVARGGSPKGFLDRQTQEPTTRSQEAQPQKGLCDGVGQQLVFPVNLSQTHQCTAHQRPKERTGELCKKERLKPCALRVEREQLKLARANQPPKAHQDLGLPVTRRDAFSAMCAAPFEPKKAHHRDQVLPLQGMQALWAVRARCHQAQGGGAVCSVLHQHAGQAQDHHIAKTAGNEAQQGGQQGHQ